MAEFRRNFDVTAVVTAVTKHTFNLDAEPSTRGDSNNFGFSSKQVYEE